MRQYELSTIPPTRFESRNMFQNSHAGSAGNPWLYKWCYPRFHTRNWVLCFWWRFTPSPDTMKARRKLWGLPYIIVQVQWMYLRAMRMGHPLNTTHIKEEQTTSYFPLSTLPRKQSSVVRLRSFCQGISTGRDWFTYSVMDLKKGFLCHQYNWGCWCRHGKGCCGCISSTYQIPYWRRYWSPCFTHLPCTRR